MNFLIFLSDYGFDKANVLLELTKSYSYRFFFRGHFTCATSPHLTHAYAPVVTDCKNVYFLLASRWVKPIMRFVTEKYWIITECQ